MRSGFSGGSTGGEQGKAESGGIIRAFDGIGDAAKADRYADTSGCAEGGFDIDVEVAHFSTATDKDDTLRKFFGVAGELDFIGDTSKDFVETVADDAIDVAAFEGEFIATLFDDDFFVVIFEQTGDKAALDVLSDFGRDLKKDSEVVGDVVSADRNNTDILKIAIFIDGDTGSSITKVDDGDAIFTLFFGQDGSARGHNARDELFGGDATTVKRFFEIDCGRHKGGDDIGAHLKKEAGHTERVFDAALAV